MANDFKHLQRYFKEEMNNYLWWRRKELSIVHVTTWAVKGILVKGLVCEVEKSIKDTKKLQVFFTCLHCDVGEVNTLNSTNDMWAKRHSRFLSA